MGIFTELKKSMGTFSFQSLLRSNILSSNTTFSPIGTGSGSMLSGARGGPLSATMVSSKLLGAYYPKLQELKDYEVTELTNTVVGIFKDYIINFFNKENDIITLKGSEAGNELFKHQDRINKIFKELGLVDEIKLHLFEIIYYGQYCIKVDWDEENRKFVKYDIQNPYNVVTVYKMGKVEYHLVVSRDGGVVKVAPNSIIRFGTPDLHLINDRNENYLSNGNDDTIIKSEDFITGYPLYYNLANKVKEYLLKDQVVSILAIKDLIQPILLLLKYDKNTSPDQAIQLASSTEKLINKHADMSAIFGANFSFNNIIDSLINNVLVVPDQFSTLGDMSTVNLDKITEKITEIRNEQEQSKDNILTSLGIPRTLFAGEVTKWEAIKSSERLNSKVNSYVTQITDGLIYTASMFYFMITGEEFRVEDIECNLFTKTQVDYNTSISNAEIVSNLMEAIKNMKVSAEDTLGDQLPFNKVEFARYFSSKLKIIDTDIMKFFGEREIQLIKDKFEGDEGEPGSMNAEGGEFNMEGGPEGGSEPEPNEGGEPGLEKGEQPEPVEGE